MSRTHVSALLLIAAVVWGSVLILLGNRPPVEYFRPFSIVVAVMLGVIGAFDLWLWRLPFLRGWFVKRPVLKGTWRGVLQSNWQNPSTLQPVPPIETYVTVRQTYNSVSWRLMTAESSSRVLAADIVRSSDGLFSLVGVYQNEPRLGVRERSPIHNGALILEVRGQPASSLEGHYWTDRNTAGELRLDARTPKIFDEFGQARAAFGQLSKRTEGDGQ